MADLHVWVADGEGRGAWDALLAAWPRHSVFATPAYHELFLAGSRSAVCLHFVHEAGELVYPVILRSLAELPFIEGPLAGCRDAITAPYGTGGPFVCTTDDEATLLRGFFKAYGAWCRDTSIVSEYTTFPPVAPKNLGYPGKVSERMPVVVKPLQGVDLLADMSKTKRNEVRQAEARGVRVEVDTVGAEVDGFVRAYESTRLRHEDFDDGLDMSASGVLRIMEALRPNALLFHARQDERVVASALVLTNGDTLIYQRAGSLHEALRLRGAQLLLHGIGEWGRDNGYGWLQIGGGTANDPIGPLFRYKASFTRAPAVPLLVGRWVIDHDAYAAATEAWSRATSKAFDSVGQTGFFPAYRAPSRGELR